MSIKILLLALAVVISNACSTQPKKDKYDVIAYYMGDAASLQKFPLDKLTHIIYSFLHLKENKLAFDNETSRKNVEEISALKKQYPNLKIMISLGGWGGCKTCSPVFDGADNRKTFAESVVKILEETNTDGLDLDWEYPAIEGYPGHEYKAADKENFTELVKALRNAFGNKYELSFAAGGFTKFLEQSVDWKAVMPLVDRVNLMTYDLISGYSKATGHHTALYSNPKQKESTDNCVQTLLQYGVPAGKLIVGGAFYARVWKNVPPANNGLYQPGEFEAMISHNAFTTKLSADSGYMAHWDTTTKATWMYNERLKRFATFDDAKSLSEKVAYVKKYKLGGIMFWELSNDKTDDGLLDAIDESIKN